jgi:Ca2+-transporting ATPase
LDVLDATGAGRLNILPDIMPGLALLMEPPEVDPAVNPPRSIRGPLYSHRETLTMFSDAAVMAGSALTAFVYGALRYGIGARAAMLAGETLAAAKSLNALRCRFETRTVFDTKPRPGNPWLTAALGGAFAVQAAKLLLPGVRRLAGIPAAGLADIAVIGTGAGLALYVQEAVKASRRQHPQSPPEATWMGTGSTPARRMAARASKVKESK